MMTDAELLAAYPGSSLEEAREHWGRYQLAISLAMGLRSDPDAQVRETEATEREASK